MKIKTSIVFWILSIGITFGADHIVGVGMELCLDNGFARIRTVIPATPAAKAGIKAGWIVLSINGTNAADRKLSECIDLIRGEEGTKVTLELEDPANGTTNKVVMTRVKVLTTQSEAIKGTNIPDHKITLPSER